MPAPSASYETADIIPQVQHNLLVAVRGRDSLNFDYVKFLALQSGERGTFCDPFFIDFAEPGIRKLKGSGRDAGVDKFDCFQMVLRDFLVRA